jgi:hypothetical protein
MFPVLPRGFGTSFAKVIKDFRKPEPSIMLGRWKLTYCEDKVSKKIHRSNEDHCGICVDPPKEDISSVHHLSQSQAK